MYHLILSVQDTGTSQKDNLVQLRNASYITIQATFIITNNHETMIRQHKTTVLSSYMLTLSRKRKPSSRKKNFTNKGWRKASNIISPLCTNKGYTCDD